MTSVFGGAQTVPQSTNQFTSSQTNQTTNANTSQNQQASQNQMQTSSYAPNYMAQTTGEGLWHNLGQFTSPGGVPGMQIAPLTPEQYGAIGGLTSGGMGIGSALLPMGGGFLTTGGGLMGQAGQGITGEDVAGFYNPMAANVTANLQDIFAQQNLANRLGATTAAGGTGSDRAAVAQGMLAQKQGLAAGQVYTDLYQKALQAAQQQKVQQLGAGAGIAGLGLPTIGAGIGGYQTALQGASVPQAQQQAINQALYQQQMGQYQDPYLRAQALGAGIPLLNMLGGTTTATGAGQTAQQGASATTGTANQIGSGINLGQGQITYPAPSIFSQLAGLGTLGLGAASMFSDRRGKTDIQHVGKDRTSGLPLFAFRYKGDPKHYPKVIGPMAQDVEKAYPGAVKEFQSGGAVDVPSGISAPSLPVLPTLAAPTIQPTAPQSDETTNISVDETPRRKWIDLGFQYGGEVSGDDSGGDGEEGYVGGSTDYYDEEDKPESKDKLFQEYSQRQQQQETAKKPWQRAQKTLAAMNTMQKSLKGFEANTNLRGPTFPAAPWAKMSPIQLGQFQGGGVVAPRGLPMPRPGAPSLGAYPQAANYPSLLRNVGAAMGPMRRGYPVIRQEGGRVSPSTAAEWGPGQTERQSYQRNLARQAMGPERWDTARGRVVTNPTGRPTTYPVGPTPSAIVQSNRTSGIVDRWEPAPGVYQEGGAVPTPQPRPAEAPQEAEAPEPTPATSEEALRAAPAGPEPAAPVPPAPEAAGMPRVGGIGGMFSGLFGGKGGGTGEERPSPALALMQAGLGMLAASGQRDARGLPMSPLGAVGLGGMAGIQTYQGQQQQMLKERQRAIQEKNMQDLMRHRLELEKAAQARLVESQRQHDMMAEYYGVKPPTPTTAPATSTTAPTATSGLPSVEEAGEVPANNALVEAGNYNYSQGAPSYIKKGLELPAPQQVGRFSGDSIAQMGTTWLETGKLPALGSARGPELKQAKDVQAAVVNYGNALAASRGLSKEDVTEMQRTAPGMLRFILGVDGRSTVALGTAVRHLETMKELRRAWDEGQKTGNFVAWNKLKAEVGRQFGDANVTNIDNAAKIIGPEIIKALGVAGAGTSEDRQAAAAGFTPGASTAQFNGAVDTVQKLLGGQLEGRKRQAREAGVSEKKFINLIGELPYERLRSQEYRPAGLPGATPTAPALSDVDKRALDWANANPTDPRAAKIKQRLGVQ